MELAEALVRLLTGIAGETGCVTAAIHGEWVRIHPFANGNARTARVWAAWIALRYGLPVFVTVKPRPNDAAYAQAAFASMGSSPTSSTTTP